MLKKNTLAYIIGVAIGDGNLSNPNKRAVRLRITCDIRYKNIIENIVVAIKKIMPKNKVSVHPRNTNCVDISCYSNKWEELLGWKANLGPKFVQKVTVPDWIKKDKEYSKHCLKGLIETDGSIYRDRNYLSINFVTIIPELAKDVMTMLISLGFSPNIQKLQYSKYKIKHTIRIFKKANKLISLLNICKN